MYGAMFNIDLRNPVLSFSAGANDCIHLDPECGKIPMETPKVTFKSVLDIFL